MTNADDLAPLFQLLMTDIYGAYAVLRGLGPAVETPLGIVVVGHDQARSVLRDPRFAKGDADGRSVAEIVGARFRSLLGIGTPTDARDDEVLQDLFNSSILAEGGQRHQELRRLLGASLATWTTDHYRGRAEALIGQAEQAVTGREVADLIEGYARPLTSWLLAEMLGLRVERAEPLERASRRLTELVDPFVSRSDPAIVEAGAELLEMADELLASSETPTLRCLRDSVDAGSCTAGDARGLLFVLMVAGHQTLVHTIGNAAHLLGRHPELRHPPAGSGAGHGGQLWDEQLWDEVLRFDPPVQFVGRIASEAVAVDRFELGPGDPVIVSLGAANRDPAVFDDPDTFRPGRANRRNHLAFGDGARACLGLRASSEIGPPVMASLRRLLEQVSIDVEGCVRAPHLNLRGFDRVPIVPAGGDAGDRTGGDPA